jgi:hypothetical protein
LESPVLKNLAKTAFLLSILIGSALSVSFGLQGSIVVPSSGSIYYVPEAMILFEDGFESGNFAAWNGAYITSDDDATVALTYPYQGVYHGCFETGAIDSGVKYAYCYKALSPTVSEVYARAYFYIVDGLPLNDNDDRFGLISFEVGGQAQCTFRVYRSGGVDKFNVVGYNGVSTVSRSTDAVYPVEGRWYCLEFYIKVHGTSGEYRAWIDGVEQITVTNLDTTHYGTGVTLVRFGLTYTANVQHSVRVYCDSAVISTCYVGQSKCNFGVVGSMEENPAIRNFYWLFGNQSIDYEAVLPSEVTSLADIDQFGGLVIWTKGKDSYNETAIREFAKTRVVISDVWDFCNVLYPSLSNSMQVVSTNTVTYVMDWGNFRMNDLAEMRNETGNTDKLTTVFASGLASFTNITTIARYNATNTAFFHMKGVQTESGFYVMDLNATTPETEWAGIWHLFPVIKMVKSFPTGRYARWFANGINWPSFNWVCSWMTNFTNLNSKIVSIRIIGKSVAGRNINALFIGNGTRYAIIDGSIHGNEKSTTFACLRLAEVIVEDYNANGYWSKRLKELTVIIIPILNPDGFCANMRTNYNTDLNRNFPPGGNASEPETRALMNLMGNYTPIIYINNHEGRYYDPNEYWYGNYEVEPYKSFTITALQWANVTFTQLQHWGYYTDGGLNLWMGKVRMIAKSGLTNSAQAYACWKYNASTLIVESVVWYQDYHARQCLWALDYYVCASISLLTHLDKLSEEQFILHSTAKVRSVVYTGQLRIELDVSELMSPSLTKIYTGNKGKPISVKIDGVEKTEGNGWTYSNSILSVTGANCIEISW